MPTALSLREGALISFLIICVSARFHYDAKTTEFQDDEGRAIGAALEMASRSTCALVLFNDGTQSSGSVAKIIHQARPPWGVGVFHIPLHGEAEPNQSQFTQVVAEARKMRISSRCVSVVVASRSAAFLSRFAAASLRDRLLVWETRLLLVTQLDPAVLQALFRDHWNFAMMNTAALNLEERHGERSKNGPQVVRVGAWTPEHGLFVRQRQSVFPDKYSNFHGARVNVTALPWPPNWEEETLTYSPDGARVTRYSGTDYFAMETLAQVFNFSINLIPTKDFVEVTNKVEERTAFLTGLTYAIIPKRLERHDFILAYDFFYSTFSMATPSLEPRWQNLFRPLSPQVWAAVVSSLLVAFVAVRLVCRVTEGNTVTTSHEFQELFKILLGQDLDQRFARTLAGRVVFGAWLVFALVIGSAYRGNLTASLTLPVLPSRPETLREIVEAADGICMPPYGEDWKRSLLASDYELYRRLGELLYIVPSSDKALHLASEQNFAAMANRRYLDYIIALNFTEASGRSKLYVGKDNFYITPAGFPIPHDAPYKPKFQKYIFAFAEVSSNISRELRVYSGGGDARDSSCTASSNKNVNVRGDDEFVQGLYVKWRKDMVEEARKRSLKKHRAERSGKESEKEDEEASRALTLTLMQGPFLILAFGWA
ncbi:Variant Ionotropic Glutamate Receptor, partial [Penaeus vannamei]